MPTLTTPTITRRFYPNLTSVLNIEDIPEELGFVKDTIQSKIDKIHIKDFQFNKSPRGDATFYSLKIVAPTLARVCNACH
jgi:hypothetical protein